MNSNIKTINKFHVGLLVMSLTITSIMIFVYFKISYLKKQQTDFFYDFDDDENEFNLYSYYEFTGINVGNGYKTVEDIELLKRKIKIINKEQRVHYHNEYIKTRPTTSVIVIQVHNEIDFEFLKVHLNSLKNSMGISNSLLIFSHNYYDDIINNLIKKIGFAKYTQIYYPYSTQLFPDSFPGPDYKLCTNDFRCERSALRYEAFAQRKHFWWWQMNYIFDELNLTKAYNHTIIFLDIDQFVLRDFIFMAKTMDLVKMGCHECEILSLGAHAPNLTQYHVTKVNLTISSWHSDVASAGIGFNRTVWNGIKNYSSIFCNYNDYRWDATLRNLGLNRHRGQFVVLSSDAPRVIKFCKDVSEDAECSAERMIEDAANFAKAVQSALYPKNVNIQKANLTINIKNKEKKTGGWEDDRDRGLCMYLVKS